MTINVKLVKRLNIGYSSMGKNFMFTFSVAESDFGNENPIVYDSVIVGNITPEDNETFFENEEEAIQAVLDRAWLAAENQLNSNIYDPEAGNYSVSPVYVDYPDEYYEQMGKKVDKVSGKGLSTEDFTSAEKTKLSGIATGATSNDTDANLKNRANHTGTQTASTISDFNSAVDARLTGKVDTTRTVNGKALSSNITLDKSDIGLGNVDNKKMEICTGTTNASGDVTFTFAKTYSTPPKVFPQLVGGGDATHGVSCNISSRTTTSCTVRFHRTVDTSMLLGGTIDPDIAVASGLTAYAQVYE